MNIPFKMMTGKTPDMNKMHTFGTICYSYEDGAKKLDPRGKRGIFVGYDRNSPAYLVYNPKSRKVTKHRCVTFTEKFNVDEVTTKKGCASASDKKTLGITVRH